MISTHVEHPAGTGRIGVWRCELPFDIIAWSAAVYDIFELPRGYRVTRDESLGFYTEESRAMLEIVRTRAIQECTGFTLDAEIITALGKTRWIRITARVEYENGAPARLYGTKQDITGEKVAFERASVPLDAPTDIDGGVNPALAQSAQWAAPLSAQQTL